MFGPGISTDCVPPGKVVVIVLLAAPNKSTKNSKKTPNTSRYMTVTTLAVRTTPKRLIRYIRIPRSADRGHGMIRATAIHPRV
jgi:hypothetical protein